jgi:hypothetical protein
MTRKHLGVRDKKLEEKNKGHIFRKNLWTCATCKESFDKPKCDIKGQVEKNFFKRNNGDKV